MSRNGSGQYSLINNSWYPPVNGVLATAGDWQSLIEDIAAALTQSVSKDGQTPITGNLNMNGNKLTNLGAGTGTGQTLRWEQLFDQGVETDIASAATTDIGAQTSNFLRVTGTTTITSFGTNYKGPRFLRFAGAVTLTNGANLILPGNANYTTTAGDIVIAIPKATSGTADGWYAVCVTSASQISANDGASGSLFTTVQGFISWVQGKFTSLASSAGSSLVGFKQSGTGAVARTAQDKMRETVSVFDFMTAAQIADVQSGAATLDVTAALQAAIASLRKNPRSILAYVGGPTITAYESGMLLVPEGVYKLQFNAFDITQDIGLTFVGLGSRGATNYSKGKSVFKFTGASSGFAFRFAHNGARNGRFVDMDVVYEGNTFTGHLIEVTGAQGFSAQGCFFGTDGDTAGTRYTSATSLIRPTYDEFLTLENCFFSGAQYGWYDDATITVGGNTFGGSNTRILNCTFYDFAVSHMYSSPSRSRLSLNIIGTAFNPITVGPNNAFDISNVKGFFMEGCIFAPSTSATPATRWADIENVNGHIAGCSFGDLSPAGNFGGNLSIIGNYFFTTDGMTLTGGSIVSRNNEFGQGTAGYRVTPTSAISIDIGPNQFKPGMTYGYDIPADSTLLAGKINYDSGLDASTSKFRNLSGRISIRNIDEKALTTTSTAYTVAITDTGRTISATGSAGQVFTLPVPIAGTRIAITKLSSQTLTVNRGGSSVLYAGIGAAKTSVSAAETDIGGSVVLEAYGTAGWRVVSVSGTWTFA